MHAITLIVLIVGLIFVTVGITLAVNRCQSTKVIYKFIPRTFEEEQIAQAYVSDIFKAMFTQDSPWVRSVKSFDGRKLEEINKYFMSQY